MSRFPSWQDWNTTPVDQLTDERIIGMCKWYEETEHLASSEARRWAALTDELQRRDYSRVDGEWVLANGQQEAGNG